MVYCVLNDNYLRGIATFNDNFFQVHFLFPATRNSIPYIFHFVRSYLLNNFSIWCLQRFECRNHIRVIQKMNKGNRLYICGTNAHSPKDYVLYVSENYFHLTYFYKNQCDSNFSIRLVFLNWDKQHFNILIANYWI